jgi:NADP-dependent 3-hydroxy acid dehydrogenase YdfG
MGHVINGPIVERQMTTVTDTSIDIAAAGEPLAGRTAIVTGASSGIGAATARLLGEYGARVALLARRADRLDELVAEIGDTALAVPVDLADTAAIDAATARVTEEFGPVDLVVNNAGVMLAAPIEEHRTDDWQRMIDINLTGALRVVDQVVPGLVAAAAEGRTADLVNVSSNAAHNVFPSFAVYCATKAAITHFSRNLRSELGPKDVRVTNIEPGLVTTELQSHVTDAGANAWLAEARQSIEWLTAQDLAELIVFAVTRPRHVNLQQIVPTPTRQV